MTVELRYYMAKSNIKPKSLLAKCIRLRQANGQTLVEYALIIAFISVVAIASLLSLGGQVSSVYTTVTQQLNVANNGGPTAPARGH